MGMSVIPAVGWFLAFPCQRRQVGGIKLIEEIPDVLYWSQEEYVCVYIEKLLYICQQVLCGGIQTKYKTQDVDSEQFTVW